MGRVVMVVPLKGGKRGDALALLAQGPPFDLQPAGIQRCDAYVTSDEVVLLIEGPGVHVEGAGAWRDPSAWTDPASRTLGEDAPRLGQAIRSWSRESEIDGIHFGPLPGPGDSEGGVTVAVGWSDKVPGRSGGSGTLPPRPRR